METGTVRADGLTIAWSATAGDGPAALLVHGNSSSRDSFAAALEHPEARGLRLVAIDLPGHGGSDRAGDDAPEPYSVGALARVVDAAASRLGLADAVVVGHSLGAHVIVQAVAAGLLRDVRGLFLQGLAPLSSPADAARAFRPEARTDVMWEAEAGEEAIRSALAGLYGPHIAPPAAALARFRATDPALRTRVAASVAGGSLRDEHRALRELRVPVALVHGADDRVVDGAWLAACEVPTLWRGAVQTVPDAGHFVHEERPGAYVALLRAFLADMAGAAAR